jgi:hypothetical protein
MKMKKVLLIISLSFILASCEKKEDKILIADQIIKTKYYDSEIFSETNLLIYGKWEFLYITGGLAGERLKPYYEYLEVVKYGIYGRITDNKIIEIGKLIVDNHNNSGTVISFFPDARYRTDTQLLQRQMEFIGNDTLVLWDMMYDGYSSFYKRIR